jgi:hypothetical protein
VASARNEVKTIPFIQSILAVIAREVRVHDVAYRFAVVY